MRGRTTTIGVAVLMALAFAACGDDGDTDEAATSDDTESPRWLVEVGGASASGDATTLSIDDPDEQVVFFTEAPDRRVRREKLDALVTSWPQLFSDEEPNALLSWQRGDESDPDAVIELSNPSIDDGALVFEYREVAGSGDDLREITSPDDDDAAVTDVRLYIDSASFPECWFTYRSSQVAVDGGGRAPDVDLDMNASPIALVGPGIDCTPVNAALSSAISVSLDSSGTYTVTFSEVTEDDISFSAASTSFDESGSGLESLTTTWEGDNSQGDGTQGTMDIEITLEDSAPTPDLSLPE